MFSQDMLQASATVLLRSRLSESEMLQAQRFVLASSLGRVQSCTSRAPRICAYTHDNNAVVFAVVEYERHQRRINTVDANNDNDYDIHHRALKIPELRCLHPSDIRMRNSSVDVWATFWANVHYVLAGMLIVAS
jgi:hypothetical protein